MKNLTLKISSVFPHHENMIMSKLKDLKTLQYIAYPYLTFAPNNGTEKMQWEENETYVFRLKLFCFIPFGTHAIHIKEMNEEKQVIYTEESNAHVPVWNHRITLSAINAHHTEYTDEVEINAGWKTIFVYLWARCFYAHRQKKWVRLLKNQ